MALDLEFGAEMLEGTRGAEKHEGARMPTSPQHVTWECKRSRNAEKRSVACTSVGLQERVGNAAAVAGENRRGEDVEELGFCCLYMVSLWALMGQMNKFCVACVWTNGYMGKQGQGAAYHTRPH